MLALLAAVLFSDVEPPPCFVAEASISAGQVPARHPDDPPAPQLPPVSLPEVEPKPLDVKVEAPRFELTRTQIRRMTYVPAASLATVIVVPVGLGLRSGDWGSPALEMSAGYFGGYLGTLAAIATTGLVEYAGPAPDPRFGFNRGAAIVAVMGMAILPAAGTGLAVFHTGEGLHGRSAHRTENLLAAMGGALATEAVLLGAAIATKAPAGPLATLAFLPIAAGATLAYDLARGPSKGPRRAAIPVASFAIRF